MKRSEINRIVAEAEAFFEGFSHKLPPFARWSETEWTAGAASARAILDRRLGWDVTDFGRGDFGRFGLLLFTVRNGRLEDLAAGKGEVYAEKSMIARDGQTTPMHRHLSKTEDIINRGGGTLAVKLYMTAPDGGLDRETEVVVPTDGIERRFAPGGILRLAPGESVTLVPGVYHAFWAEGGDVFIGEVSTVNDDENDNIFAEPIARFPTIEEDVAPARLLVGDYGRFGA